MITYKLSKKLVASNRDLYPTSSVGSGNGLTCGSGSHFRIEVSKDYGDPL